MRNSKGQFESVSIKQRFYSKVLLPNENGCMLWSGAKDTWGYGHLKINTTMEKAHRLSYKIHCGELQKGLYVCHTCDTPACVAPDHLFLGTPKDNSRDCISKGRFAEPLYGELSPNTKLTNENVYTIKKRLMAGDSVLSIANDYNVSRTCIYFIKHDKTWIHV